MFRSFRFPLLALIGLLLGLHSSLLAGPPPRYTIEGQEKPVALLTTRKATYLVTESSVFQLERKQFVRRYRSAAPIRCAVALADSGLWLGTTQGVLRLTASRQEARPLALPGVAGPASITALFQDATGSVWIGAAGYGMLRYAAGTFTNELNVPTVNAGIATTDSSVWVATNIGLYRWQHRTWTRYNEEGVANHEIPDNIVEKLLLDNTGSLWVLMSQGISVFEVGPHPAAAEAHEHLPTVTFVGQPGNEVYSVAYLPGQGRLFTTALGLLLLPNEAAEPFGSVGQTTDKVAPQQLLVKLLPPTATAPQLLQFDPQGRAWLLSAGEVTVMEAKAFRRFITAGWRGAITRPAYSQR
jgi:hypothetical protein